jgi:hypothetical protein
MTLLRGAQGPVVKALQEQLLGLGYGLGDCGADGVLGLRTLGAVHDFEEDHGLPVESGVVSDAALAAVAEAYRRRDEAPVPQGFSDLTALCDGRYRRGVRAWNAITGITLHQTAGDLGERPERWARFPMKAPDGSVYNESLRAHVGVTRQGQILLVNPLAQLVWHGNGLSPSTIGIECSGSYEGIEGRRETWWPAPGMKDPQVPTQELVDAARRAARWIVAEVAKHGGKVSRLCAHRQSSDERQSDPGSRIWQEVGLWAQKELGLSDGGAGWVTGSGLAIPEAWDPSRKGVRY